MYNTILHRALKLLTVAMDSPSQVVRQVFTLCKIASVRALSETSDFHLNSHLLDDVYFTYILAMLDQLLTTLMSAAPICGVFIISKKKQKKPEGQGVDYNTHIRAFIVLTYMYNKVPLYI